MNDELVLHHNPMSRGRITRWMVEEVGAPFRLVLHDFKKREHKSPDYVAINPMGKIPTLEHRGVIVTEAAAICAYLADAFPEARLAPELSDPKRGTYYRWLFFGAGCIEPAIVDRMFDRPSPSRPGALGYGSYEDVVKAIEKALDGPGPYLLGAQFTAADVYFASELRWGELAKAYEPSPAAKAYVERCSARPAAIRAAAADNDLMQAAERDR